MKNLLILMTAAVLAACSHKPPQPYGKFFPINQPATEMAQAVQEDTPAPAATSAGEHPYLILEKTDRKSHE